MKFIISKRARRDIEKIQAWWVENRPAAPALFLDELAGAERRLRRKPTLGLVYVEHKSGVVRRVLLTRTSHHLYYRCQPDREELTVLAVWALPSNAARSCTRFPPSRRGLRFLRALGDDHRYARNR